MCCTKTLYWNSHQTRTSPTAIMGVTIHLVCVAVLALALTHVSAQTTELEYTIQEERPSNALIGNILQHPNMANLVQGVNTRDLRFRFLTEGNPQASYLWVNITSGDLKAASRIDRESICRRQTTCDLRVQTVVQAELGAFFMIVLVKVMVMDINDNAPAFSPTSVTLKISENEVPGALYTLPTADDPDMGSGNSIVAYNQVEMPTPFTFLVSGSASASFDLRLRLDERLDRELTPSYQLLVRAVDGGEPRLTGTLTVNIEVLDVNDNAPVFDRSRYAVNVSEGNAVDSVVVAVRATDQDTGLNGAVTYALPSTQEDQVVFSMFYVNASTGEVRTLKPLDTYAGRTYRLTINAQDSGLPSNTDRTDVYINVMDTHNSEPEILLNVFGVDGKTSRVSELAELGRAVAYFSVSDPDSNMSPNGQVTCSLDNDRFQLQALDVYQYKVILTSRLDREQLPFHSITVVCVDSGSPPLNASANFLVEVQDENDNPPVFDSLFYTSDVTEGPGKTGVDSPLLRVHATDQDTGINAVITYRLADGSDTDFGISRDGAIFVANPRGVDREDKVKGTRRDVVVLAIDGGSARLTGTATVVVTVRDINDNPPRFSEPVYYFNVAENSPVGRLVNNVSATDDDLEVNAIFYFKMAPNYTYAVPFEVSLDGGIKVAGDIDRERRSNYEFKVIAYDLGEPVSLSSMVTVNVKVTDVNDNKPVFMFPNDDNSTLFVPHTLSANTMFANIIATDQDEGRNSVLVYTADGGNGTKFFDIVSDSGQILLTRTLSVSDVGLHVLIVVAQDLGYQTQLSAQSVLHIMVYEGNATAPLQGGFLGFRNIIVVIILIVVTLVLALVILLTIILIRRVDKQRRLYHAKQEESKVDANIRHMYPCPSEDMEAPGNLPDINGDAKEGAKKKKEVSFSLDEDNNINHPPAMTTFNPIGSDKYDLIPEKDRSKVKTDLLTSNHYQADKHTKSASSKKDINNFNFHQVHPAGPGHVFTNRQTDHLHEDNLSDASGDLSTSDSGRGGSDVEQQSHGGASRDSGDTSFASSQRRFNSHNNLNTTASTSSTASIINHSVHNINSHALKAPSNKSSQQFHNIHPDPPSVGTFLSPNTPASSMGRPARGRGYVLSGAASQSGIPSSSQFTSNVFHNDGGAYVPPTNGSSGRRSNLSNQGSEFHKNKPLIDFSANQNHHRHPNAGHPHGDYIDMSGRRSNLSQRSNSNSCVDGAGAWDADTTTSGSYTVDPVELCDEIDHLFFNGVKDVVV